MATTEPIGNGLRPALDPEEARLVALMDEFRRRQRKRPDVAVRPWWTPGTGSKGRGTIGFVLEYCPRGVDSAQVVVRTGRVTAEGPAGVREAGIDLRSGWIFDSRDAGCPETFANYLIRLAGQTLGEGSA